MPHECVVELEERAVPGVAIDQQHCIGQVLASRYEFLAGIIVSSIPFTTRQGCEIRRSSSNRSPSTRSHARNASIWADLWARPGLPIPGACREPRHERLPGRLARLARGKEELHQNPRARKCGVLEDVPEFRFLQVHDVLTACRGGADQQHLAGRSIWMRPSASAKAKVRGHPGDRGGHFSGRASHAGTLEQDDLAPPASWSATAGSQLSRVPVKCCRNTSGGPAPPPNRR